MGQVAKQHTVSSLRAKGKKDLAALNIRLQSLCDRLDEISTILDLYEIINYSYGLPHLNPDSKETVKDTANVVVKIFDKMVAEVMLKDIDIAHSQPKPIICKFV